MGTFFVCGFWYKLWIEFHIGGGRFLCCSARSTEIELRKMQFTSIPLSNGWQNWICSGKWNSIKSHFWWNEFENGDGILWQVPFFARPNPGAHFKTSLISIKSTKICLFNYNGSVGGSVYCHLMAWAVFFYACKKSRTLIWKRAHEIAVR